MPNRSEEIVGARGVSLYVKGNNSENRGNESMMNVGLQGSMFVN